MAITLVINTGSTSKKFAFYDSNGILLSLRFEETGTGFDVCVEKAGTRGHCKSISAPVYASALKEVLRIAVAEQIISGIESITKVGVRVVSPGTHFQKDAQITEEYIAKLEQSIRFAPLHIPLALDAIMHVQKLLPDVAIVAVSDSAFHRTLSRKASEYSLPHSDVEAFGLKRYGYHGISVSSTSRRLATVFGELPERTIVCHVGGGVSVTALKNGKSVETSMGFTPASGLMMNTRAGDVDAGVFAVVADARHLRGKELHEYLHRESGFKGVTGVKDMRLVLDRRGRGDESAKLAVDMFVHQFIKLVGAYYAVLGGLNAIVLTGTAMVRNPEFRALLCGKLDALGADLDTEKNEAIINREDFIHTEESSVKIAIMKTDEMDEINRITNTF